VNGIAAAPFSNLVLYAASEWGGLYKTLDGGQHWLRLDGHRPTATWDVKVNPGNPNLVLATSYYDGRQPSLSGINFSNNAGATWTRPATAVPPAGFCANAADQTELSAFGIGYSSGGLQVYVGTSCGLAISTNAGGAWSYSSPVAGAGRIYDVQVSSNGSVVDTCGDAGHRRYTVATGTWSAGSGLPSGMCSLAASPYSTTNQNMFAAVGTAIYETEDGENWAQTRTNPAAQGRIPFVATNRRAGGLFDLWFGDVSLFRVSCDPAAAGPNCGTGNVPAWSGPYTRTRGGHDDLGSIVFDATKTTDACPILMSSDGGVYVNTITTSPACHDPLWNQPAVTPRALWPFALSGADPSGANNESLYFGNQDNGVFGTTNAGAPSPSWTNDFCCDSFDAAASSVGSGSVVYSVCCSSPVATKFYRANADFSGRYQINIPTSGAPPGFRFPDALARWGDKKLAMVTSGTPSEGGLFMTSDVEATPITWTELGHSGRPNGDGVCENYPPRNCASCSAGESCFFRQPCAVYSAASSPGFYVQTGDPQRQGCDGNSVIDQMFYYPGTDPNVPWLQRTLPGGEGFGIFAVDPSNNQRLMASGLTPTGASMYRSNDGGASWMAMPSLDAMLNGGGDFPMRSERGLFDFNLMAGYWQPSFAAFDPYDSSNVIAGGHDSGIFYSTDNGTTWTLVTDPRNSNTSGIPHIPRPKHAYFSEADHNKTIYVTSQGRGVWRLGICSADAYEPDDTSATAKPIAFGETQQRSLCGTGDSDWASINVPTARWAGRIETAGATGDTTIRLRDSNGTIIATDTDSGVDLFSRINVSCRAGGAFTVEVVENGGDDTIANYTLSLTATPCCGNGIIDPGEQCDDGNTVAGDCCSSCLADPAHACDDGNACTTGDSCIANGTCAGTAPAVPGSVVGLTMSSTTIDWPMVPGAHAYDLTIGNLNALESTGGDFTAASQGCLSAQLAPNTFDHPGTAVAPGDALFYLVRATNCSGRGTYDDASAQTGSRDVEIQAGPSPCP
jgi:cysteine-rich repeat protein